MYLSDDARAVFDAMREGITIIDTEGRIVFGNRAYREFLNKEAGGDIGPIEGCKLRELRPGARLPGVLEAGKPILHITRQEIQDFYFVNMYPIYEDGELKGGVSVVTFLEDAYQAKEELEAAEARSKQVLRRLNRANGARYTFDDIVAVSPEAMQGKELAQRIAALSKEGQPDVEAARPYQEQFQAALGNDLNTSLGLTVLYDVLKADLSDATKRYLVDDFDQVLSLGLLEAAEQASQKPAGKELSPEETAEIEALIQKRAEARKAKDWATADAIRDQLAAMHVVMKDTPGGVEWHVEN